MANAFLGLAIISLAIGLIGRHNPIVDGLGKAMFGVLLISFLIVRLFGQKEA